MPRIANIGARRCQRLHTTPTLVLAAVVDQDDFSFSSQAAKYGFQPRNQLVKCVIAVKNGHDNGDRW
jgi:hypothetical protein